MSAREVLGFFARCRDARLPLALVTVVETEGSTYTKAGHRILIAANGDFQGLVSGGCLEGDLAAHARDVLARGEAALLTYDLRDEHDELFGLGIGCNGLFRVLLQPMSPDTGYAPFAAIAACALGDTEGTTATVVASEDPPLAPGATLVACGERQDAEGIGPAWLARLAAGCAQRAGSGAAALAAETVGGRAAQVLYAPLRPLPRLLVVGAGLDAVPLADMATRLGWRVTVADHRAGHLGRGDFGEAERMPLATPAEIARALPHRRYDAAVVMTHHLDSDRAYLRALAGSAVPYVGLLGPVARRERLVADLGDAAAALVHRLHAPVGLPIGADTPETIALAVLAQIHAVRTGHGDIAALEPLK